MTPYLQATGVEVSFGGLKALNDCSLTVKQGRITCLVGPNGAGKTTIFNVITGFLRPNAGSVSFKGQTLDRWKPQAIVGAGVARTFQNLRLFTDITALDNVLASLPSQTGEEPIAAIFRPFHVAAAQRRRRAEALEILDRQ
jgi:ABC-type branched-subunit amino acid transport system ATPase component